MQGLDRSSLPVLADCAFGFPTDRPTFNRCHTLLIETDQKDAR